MTPDATPEVLALGILFSGASGFWAIGFLLNYLRKRSVSVFFWWRALVALGVFLFARGA